VVSFIVRRVAWAFVLLLAVSLITFVIFFVLPAAPLGRGQIGTEEVSIRDAFPFSGPLWQEYYEFTKGVFVDGDLGRSLSTREPVAEILLRQAPITLSLILGGLFVTLLIAVPIGVLSALKPRSLVDRFTMVFVVVGISLHPAWLGLMLAYFLGYKWQVAPLQGYCDVVNPGTDCGGPAQWAYHLLLPWLTFSAMFAAMYARMIRAVIVESLREDYVRTARAKGAPESVVVRSHAIRNALLPVVTMLGTYDAGLYFVNVIFIERVFALPGVGSMMFQGLTRRDPPLVLGVVMFVAVTIVVFTLIMDIVYSFLDPRVRTPTKGLSLPFRSRRARERAKVAPAASGSG
jgi:peptide/nickel transport system permease protein